MTDHRATYGLLAEYADETALVAAARRAHEAGYRRVEAYTAYPVEGLAEALGSHRTRIPLVVLVGGIVGGLCGYGLQYWAAAIAYPINIGGRPLHSWPAFIPVTFEMTILAAALAAVLGMLALNGLPRPHHPLFAVPAFDRAAQNGFFLCIRAVDGQFDMERTAALLRETGAEVTHVEA